MNKPETLKLLLIEDNKIDASLIKELLKGTVFEIVHTDRIYTALQYVQQTNFTVVIMDLTLPDSKGLETVDIFINNSPISLPIVITTASEDERVGILALRKGVQDYLVKGQITKNSLIKSLLYSIERQGLINRTKFYQQQQQNILDASKVILKSKDVKESIKSLFNLYTSSIQANIWYVAIMTGNEILFIDSENKQSNITDFSMLPLNKLAEKVFFSGKVTYFNDLSNLNIPNINNVMFIPVLLKFQPLALIVVINKQGGFTDQDVLLSNLFSELAAICFYIDELKKK